jgi:hypothetical protein
MRHIPAIAILAGLVGGCAPLRPTPTLPPMPDIGSPLIQQGEPSPAPVIMQYAPPIGPGAPTTLLANPLRMPVGDRDFAWDQIIAVVEEYFKIEHEDRVRLAGDLLTEGRIDTYPLIAATLLEPWNGDSVTFDDRLRCTLQSKRRRCYVRVIPEQASYLVEVVVLRELEDLPRPLMATAGTAVFDKVNGQDRVQPEALPSLSESPGAINKPAPRVGGWIPEGREIDLEQIMLAKMQARLSASVVPVLAAPPGFAPTPGFAPAPGPVSP